MKAAALFLFFLVIAAYCVAAVHSDFFLLDDRVEIEAKYRHFDFTALNGWREALLASSAGPSGRPVSVVSFGVNALISGDISPSAFKVTNVLIHALNALVLLAWLRALALRMPGIAPGTAALIWFVLPIHVSTVLYVVQRMAELSAFFVLVGLLLFTRVRNRWLEQSPSRDEVAGLCLWLALTTAAAVCAKETGILLPWLLALVEFSVFRGRIGGLDRGPAVNLLRRLAAVCLIMPIVLMPLLIAATGLLEQYDARPFDVWERLLTQTRVLILYLQWIALPLPSSLGLFHDEIDLSTGVASPFSTTLALLTWTAVCVAAFYLRRRIPIVTFSLLFFLITHSLESSFLPLELVFEHRNYLPSVAVALLLAAAIGGLGKVTGANARLLRAAIFLPMVVSLALRLGVWADEGRFYAHEASRDPGGLRAGFLYADYLQREASEIADGAKRLRLLSFARDGLLELRSQHPQSAIPCTGLYLLDTEWFPGNPEESDWLACVTSATSRAAVSRVERNAVMATLRRGLETAPASDAVRVLLERVNTARLAETELEILQLLHGIEAGQIAGRHETAKSGDYPPAPAELTVPASFLLLDRAVREGAPGRALDMALGIYGRDPSRRYLSALMERLGE